MVDGAIRGRIGLPFLSAQPLILDNLDYLIRASAET